MVVEVNFDSEIITVSGNYTPATPPRFYYYDGSGHPGYPADFEIMGIVYMGVDVTNLLERSHERIIELVLEQIN